MDTSGLHNLARFFLTVLCCALLSLSLTTVLSSTAFCYDLTILTENSGENNYLDSNGQIKGFNTDIVREIMQRLNLNFPINIVPWKRGYHEVLHRPNVVLFSMVRTFEREKLFKWVGPMNVTKFSFFKKKDSDININTLGDAKKVGAIGCIGDDVREKLLKRLGFTNLSSLFGKDANLRNLEMLMLGRIDLWISTDQIVFKTANDTGIDPKEIEETLTVKKKYVYLAFSKDTDDKIVNEWQHTLEAMKKDGTYKKILSQYPSGLKRITFDPPTNAPPE